MRIAGFLRKIVCRILVCLLCAGLLVTGARAQQSGNSQNNDPDSARSFIDSIAQTTYNLAWPTATYKSVSFDGFEPADGGFNIIVKLSGLSAFDSSDLWLKLAFLFRNGSLQDVQVRDDNAILVRPFATTKALAGVAAQLAEDYAKDQNQQQNAAPAAAPAGNAVPDTGSTQAVPAPPADAPSSPAAQPAPAPQSAAQPAPSTAAVATGIRAYLVASTGGFANLITGEPRLAANNVREWDLRTPDGAQITCYAGQVTRPVIDCPLYESNKEDVDLMAGDVAKAINASLPLGWTSSGNAVYSSDPSKGYVTFDGPGDLWAELRFSASDTSGQYWLEFEIVFPQ